MYHDTQGREIEDIEMDNADEQPAITYPLTIAKSDYRETVLLAHDYEFGFYDTIARITDSRVEIRKTTDGGNETQRIALIAGEMDALVQAWQAHKAAHPPVNLDEHL